MDKMAELLKVLAEKAETSVDKLGPHLVRHTQALAWSQIGLCIAIMAMFWLVALLIPRYLDKGKLGSDDDRKVARLIASLLAAVMSVVMLCLIGDQVPALIEPIGATLKALVGAS